MFDLKFMSTLKCLKSGLDGRGSFVIFSTLKCLKSGLDGRGSFLTFLELGKSSLALITDCED